MTDLLDLVKLRKEVADIQRIEILDIGSGLVQTKMTSLLINHRNEFKYTAIDNKKECWIFNEKLTDNEVCFEKIDKKDWIKKINSELLYAEGRNCELTSETEFTELFSLNFETDAVQFCTEIEQLQKFDIIILSNLLHFLKREVADHLFRTCLSMLNENGIIQVVVLNDQQNKYLKANLYNESHVNKMKKGLNIIAQKNSENHICFVGSLISNPRVC